MILEIKNCHQCPFCNNDNEYGRDMCNLADRIFKDIALGEFEQLPSDKRHKDCPIVGKIEVVAYERND